MDNIGGADTAAPRSMCDHLRGNRPTTPIVDQTQEQHVTESVWNACLRNLELEVPEEYLNTWVRPLQAVEHSHALELYAPNRFVEDWIKDHLLERVRELVLGHSKGQLTVRLRVGTSGVAAATKAAPASDSGAGMVSNGDASGSRPRVSSGSNINPRFTFETFVEGKSNQLARAACKQIAGNPGQAYNPLFLYGGVGLG